MSLQINQFTLVGEIKKVQVSEPKDPRKNASAVLLVQYGPSRETTGGPVEFVNAVQIRIPSYKYPQLREQLKVGRTILINGHLQGVFRSVMDDGHFVSELVADRVTVATESDSRAAVEDE